MTDLKFLVVRGQLDVERIQVHRATSLFAAFTIVTAQEYPELMTYSASMLWARPGEHTPQRQVDPSLPEQTGIGLPRAWRMWEMTPESVGKYSLNVAVYRPSPRYREAAFTTVTQDDWVRMITQPEEKEKQ